MPAPGKTSKSELSRERILGAASRAVRRAGHSGASVAEVMKEAGLTHGGFYAHFASRDEMVAAAIAFAGVQANDSLAQSMAALQVKGASPFRSLIDAYLSPAHMAAVESGCVIAALGSEMPRQPDLVLQAARERVLALIRLVESVLPAGAGQAAAPHIASTMAGALQMARILGGDEGGKLLDLNRAELSARYP